MIKKKKWSKGFSLVELIVVLAIMAVLTAVLAPVLLSYTERSRMQKDDSAMSELVNVIRLGLTDEKTYNAMVSFAYTSCPSCYIDTETEAESAAYLQIWKNTGDYETSQWTYSDDARRADEIVYKFAGKMRGLTVTFMPLHVYSNYSEIHFDEVACNEVMMDESLRASDSWRATRSDYWCDYGDMTNGDLDNPATPLWKHIHGAFDTGIKLTSQTYRFSAYTVFIKVGNAVTGDPNSADATQVYGQWNGTDLSFQQQWWASHVQDHAGWGGGYIACGD